MIRYCTSLLLLVIIALSSAVSTISAAVDHKVVDRLLTQLEVLNDNKKSSSTHDKNSNDIKMLMELHRLLTDIEKLNDNNSRKLPGDDDKEDDKKDEKKDDDKKKEEDDKKGGKDEQENSANGISEGEMNGASSSSYVAMMFGLVASSAVSVMLF